MGKGVVTNSVQKREAEAIKSFMAEPMLFASWSSFVMDTKLFIKIAFNI